MSEQEYKCPCCRSSISWEEGAAQASCPECGSTIDTAALREYGSFAEQCADKSGWTEKISESFVSGIMSGVCRRCGARLAAFEEKQRCPVCDEPVTLAKDALRLAEPYLVVKFNKDKSEAEKAFSDFCRRRLFLPKGFACTERISQIQAVYASAWLFDCSAKAGALFDAAKEKRWHDASDDYEKTDSYLVIREGVADIGHIPVGASDNMSAELLEAAGEYDITRAVKYEKEALSGCVTGAPAEGSAAAQTRADEIIKQNMSGALRSTVTGYSAVNQQETFLETYNTNVRSILLPMWVLTTRCGKREYRFVMNGQTGKFTCGLPTSKTKLAALFAGVALAVTLIGTAVTLLLF